MSFNATVNIIKVMRVYPLKNQYTRCLVLLQSQIGTTPTTEKAFIITPPHLRLSEGMLELSALITVNLRKATWPTVRIASKNHQMYLNAALSLSFKAF